MNQYDDTYKNVLSNLVSQRLKAGLKQTVVARKLQVSQPTISRIENGKRALTYRHYLILSSLYTAKE